MSSKLYRDLYDLRERLKEEGRRLDGRAPLVCSDEALENIAAMQPKKISDFEAIDGIGRSFIDKYAVDFLVVIERNLDKYEKSIKKTSSIDATLKELEKKLVNINKRNRLLYASSINTKYGYDLLYLGKNNIERLLFSNSFLNICNLNKNNSKEELKKFKSLVRLLREINKDIRDKGQNDLYIGYPFVIGKMHGENFDIHSPLVLFPVTFERDSSTISLRIDETRDIVYNQTLLLAYYKFNNINNPLPDTVIDDCNKDNFINNVINFYKDKGINITINSLELTNYQEFKAKEFPNYNSGELHLECSCVLGKYQICSSSIQRDFDKIIEEDEINLTLNKLLENISDIDYYDDSFSEDVIDDTVEESQLFYINDLNSSQEKVLSSIDKIDNLVVQGPPGTGKSQIITSLIGKYVNSGKTVLMVSEKKTALDVVYSRLGNLSRYVMLIDDVNNKELFYKQLESMLIVTQSQNQAAPIAQLTNDIDYRIDLLEDIADKLYQVNDFGIEPYKMYLLSEKFDLNKTYVREKVKSIKDSRSDELKGFKYHELKKLHDYFNDSELDKKLVEYLKVLNNYNWLAKMNLKLNEYEVLDLETDTLIIKGKIEEWNSFNFIKKIFTKGKVKKSIKEYINKYFINVCDDFTDFIFESIYDILEGISYYNTFKEYKPLYDVLDENQRLYFDAIFKACKGNRYYPLEINHDLLNQIITEHIYEFESENVNALSHLNDFDNIVLKLSKLIDEKKELSKRNLNDILQNYISELSLSKRFSEISRVVESKRKWSVNKFVNKFNFELFKNIKVWLLTPEVVSEIIPLQVGLFDLVIFDEASQMYVEKGIPSILRAKKVVIAGDHKQLRPSNLGAGRIEIDVEDLDEDVELGAALEEESLLDLARFKYRDVMLDCHYRSKYEELINFSNYAFYKGRLHVSPNTEKLEKPPIEVHKIEDGLWTNRANVEEARYIVSMLKTFFSQRENNETIGIITFNSNQRSVIEDLIDEECAKDKEFENLVRAEMLRKQDGEDIGLFVKNIETVQGDERDVIIFSIGYAKNEQGKIMRNFGWLNQRGGENRLNVAITRAKRKIHIVTSIVPAQLQVEDTLNDGPKFLKKYLEYCFAISDNNKKGAEDILLSFNNIRYDKSDQTDNELVLELFEILKHKGLEVDRNVGIGGYSIDLAIKKNGRYVLGIECDSKLYQNSSITRERDYHRKKYLESRGWVIHRVWSSNIWKDKDKEIEKIISLVNRIEPRRNQKRNKK